MEFSLKGRIMFRLNYVDQFGSDQGPTEDLGPYFRAERQVVGGAAKLRRAKTYITPNKISSLLYPTAPLIRHDKDQQQFTARRVAT